MDFYLSIYLFIYVYLFIYFIYFLVVETELYVNKNRNRSPLVSCFKAGTVPGVLAMLAILVSKSWKISREPFLDPTTEDTESDEEERAEVTDEWHELRMLRYFQKYLGSGFELQLARKMRDQIRAWAKKVIAMSTKLRERQLKREIKSKRKKERKEIATKEKKQSSADEGLNEEIASEGEDGAFPFDAEFEPYDSEFEHLNYKELEKERLRWKDEENEESDKYEWLLFRVRVFLLAYSLLDDFYVRRDRATFGNQENEEKDISRKDTAWPLVCLDSVHFYSQFVC
jgi:hypothetical protein